ncbi:hypothetical protein GCG54_00012175 [Colletotrichum gloeosporioides]|uniref:Uncharacterized protein n=1 Tax=Colletotrichum gloeosporioides TaxID=474922 RepID=A0A8H4CIW3_COLGL|nr:uncharacterized protein GCG54_00012175 [Colletotrichum gloeosporioides]KAF3804686.1 hypothetical protein GCG54_00012175 [Colletotrichum gloeosporioides]
MDGVNHPVSFRCGDSEFAFGNNPRADSLTLTWTAPGKNDNENNNPAGNQAIAHQNFDGNANAGDNGNGANNQGNDRKRRRVHVEIEKHRVTVLKLGSDVAFDFRSAAAESERQLANTITERDQLQAQLTNIAGVRENLQHQCDDLKQQRDRYYTELVTVTPRTVRLQAAHNNLRTQHEALLGQNAQLKTELAASQANVQVLITNDREYQKLKGEHATLKNDNQALKNEYETLQEQHTTLKADLEGQTEEWEYFLGNLHHDVNEGGFEFRIKQAEAEVREVRDQMDDLQDEYRRLESDKNEALEHLETAQSELQEAKEETQNLKNELAEQKETEEYVRIIEKMLEKVANAKKGAEEHVRTVENKLEAETARAAGYASQLHQLQKAANRSTVEDNANGKLEVKELQDKNATKDVQIAALEAALKQANEKQADMNRWVAKDVYRAKKNSRLGVPSATDNIMEKDSEEMRTRALRRTADATEKNSAEELRRDLNQVFQI